MRFFKPAELGPEALDAARGTVLDAVGATALGRALLRAVDALGVDIQFTNSVQKDTGLHTEAFGLYDARSNTIYINASCPLHEQLHYFAHEARHALQMQESSHIYKRHSFSEHDISPLTHIYMMRLREMDADVFAVHFMAQHDIQTGSGHFAAMMKSSKGLFQAQSHNREGLYKSFFTEWSENGHPDNMDGAAHAAAAAFLRNTELLRTYNNFALDVWEKAIWEPLQKGAEKPHSAEANTFSAIFNQSAPDQSPRDVFNHHAKAYGKILTKEGAPDYLRGIKPEDLVQSICAENTDADPWKTTGGALEKAVGKFTHAKEFFKSSPLKPANSNKPSPAAQAVKITPPRRR